MAIAALIFREQGSFKFIAIFMGVFFVGYALVVYLWDRLKAYRTRGWLTSTATVTTVELEDCTGAKGIGYTRLTVAYAYQASGEQKGVYKFNKDLRSSAEELAESLPGTEFPVRFDPKVPGNSVVMLMDRPD